MEAEVEVLRISYDVEALMRAQAQEQYERGIGGIEEEADIDSDDDIPGWDIALYMYK